jgi:hypothetical protein
MRYPPLGLNLSASDPSCTCLRFEILQWEEYFRDRQTPENEVIFRD